MAYSLFGAMLLVGALVTPAWAVRPSDLIPVYARSLPLTNDQMLSTDPRAGIGTYTFPLLVFYVEPLIAGVCKPGTTRLFGLYNSMLQQHAYTIDASDRLNKINNLGYTPDTTYLVDGVVGCVAVTGEDYDRVPLYEDGFTIPGGTRYGVDLSTTNTYFCSSGGSCSSTQAGFVWQPARSAYTVRTYNEPYNALTLATLDKTKSGHISKGSGDGVAVVVPFPSGFRFPFYGVNYASVKITTNGLATFNPVSENAEDVTGANVAIPVSFPLGTNEPHNFIAGWWDHSLMLDDTNFLWTWTGTAPNREFIVQWGKGTWANDGHNEIVRDMQIHLFETTGRIEIHYGPYVAPTPGDATVDAATVGLGDPYGGMESVIGMACQPSCNQANWQPDQVLAFIPGLSGYIVTESHPANETDPTDPNAYISLVEGPGGATSVGANVAQLQLGFKFQFDGQNFTSVWASAAGTLAFGGAPPTGLAPAQRNIPNIYAMNEISPWWDDMVVDQSDGKDHFLYQSIASDPRTKQPALIIEWQNFKHAGGADPTTRFMQVELFSGTNEILFHYGSNNYAGGTRLDSATVGIQDSTGDGDFASYRLLECTPTCNEGRREPDFTKDDIGGRWPSFAKYLFTPDATPPPNWHSIYWLDFMPAAYTPTGVAASAGHCGDCHTAAFNYSERDLFQHMFDAIPFPAAGASCTFTGVDTLGPWTPPLLVTNFLGIAVGLASSLITPDQTAVAWMTDPHGGIFGDEGNMPYDVSCKGGTIDANSNDTARSTLKRWILRGSP